jgi:hypothetical protein
MMMKSPMDGMIMILATDRKRKLALASSAF